MNSGLVFEGQGHLRSAKRDLPRRSPARPLRPPRALCSRRSPHGDLMIYPLGVVALVLRCIANARTPFCHSTSASFYLPAPVDLLQLVRYTVRIKKKKRQTKKKTSCTNQFLSISAGKHWNVKVVRTCTVGSLLNALRVRESSLAWLFFLSSPHSPSSSSSSATNRARFAVLCFTVFVQLARVTACLCVCECSRVWTYTIRCTRFGKCFS